MVASVNRASQAALVEQQHVPQPRLVRAAHEFEAQMMKELLAPLSRTGAMFGADGGEDSGIMGEFAAESLAGALSAGGGLGMADRIIRALAGGSHDSAGHAGTGAAQGNGGISTGQ
jgi:Rod binding domain-containing protein